MKLISGIVLTLLLTNMLTLAFDVAMVRANEIVGGKKDGSTKKLDFSAQSSSEPPATEWNKTYGGLSADSPGFARSLVQTLDGGYVMAGLTASFEDPDGDFYLVKADAHGNMQWNKTYGTTGMDKASAVVQTSDGGYAIAGSVWMGTFYYADFFLVKTDAFGTSQWSHEYPETGSEYAYSMIQTSDGGYAIAGEKYSPSVGNTDFWFVKTDANGNMEWNKTYGGLAHDGARCVIQTKDEGYALVGFSGFDSWFIKTDENGNMEWSKTYGGVSDDVANSVVQTIDGGYIIAGSTRSFGAGWDDVWLVKIEQSGNMQWNKTYGGSENDGAISVIQTSDRGYAILGTTWSFGIYYDDPWLIKTDTEGNMQWDKVFGGPFNDGGHTVIQTRDGGYALLCSKSLGYPNYDFWLIKIAPEQPIPQPDFEILVSPSAQAIIGGKSTTYLVTTKSIEDFTSPISLTLSGLPSDASYSFDPNPVDVGSSSTLTITTTSSTPEGTYTLTITGTDEGKTHSTTVTLTIVSQWIDLVFDTSVPESNKTYISQLFDEVYPQLVLAYGYPSTFYRLRQALTITLKYNKNARTTGYINWPLGPSGTITLSSLPTVGYSAVDLAWDKDFTHELTHGFHDALLDLLFRWNAGPWVKEGMTEAASRIALMNLKLSQKRETIGDVLMEAGLEFYDTWNYTGANVMGLRGSIYNKFGGLDYYGVSASMWIILSAELAVGQSYDFLGRLNRQMYADAEYALAHSLWLGDSWVKSEVDKVSGSATVEGMKPSDWISSQSVAVTNPEPGNQLAVHFNSPINPSTVMVIAFKRSRLGRESPIPREVITTVQIINSSGYVVGTTTITTDPRRDYVEWNLESAEFYPLPPGAYEVVATANFGHETKTAKNFGLVLGKDLNLGNSGFYGVTLDSTGAPRQIVVSAVGGEVVSDAYGTFVIQTHIVTIPFEITVIATGIQKIFAKPNPFTRIVCMRIET